MRHLLCSVISLSVCTTANAQETRRVAIFPLILKGDVDFDAVEQVQSLLIAGVEGAELTIVHGSELRRSIRRRPRSAISRCEKKRSFAACVAKLAIKARVDEVLIGRVTAANDVMKIVVLAVKPNRAVEPRASVEIASGAVVTDQATPAWIALALDAEPPDALPAGQETPEPEPEPITETAVAAADEAASPPGAPATAPESALVEEVTAAAVSAAVADMPPASDSPGAMTATSGAPMQGVRAEMEEPGWRPVLRWTGVALAGAGAAAVGVGGYMGLQAQSANDELRARTGLMQDDAKKVADRAADNASNANLLFAVGGGALVTGVVLFVTEIILD